MALKIEDLRNIHDQSKTNWDPIFYELLSDYTNQMTLLTHDRKHKDGDTCIEILKEAEVNLETTIPVVTLIGSMKDFDGERKPLLISFPGVIYKKPLRKVVGPMLGTSALAAKEVLPLEGANIEELLGLPFGASSPFINSSKFNNFYWVAVVFDSSFKADTYAIAASQNSTLLIPRVAYEKVILSFCEVHPELKIIHFPIEA